MALKLTLTSDIYSTYHINTRTFKVNARLRCAWEIKENRFILP